MINHWIGPIWPNKSTESSVFFGKSVPKGIKESEFWAQRIQKNHDKLLTLSTKLFKLFKLFKYPWIWAMTLTWPRRAGLGEPKQMVAVGIVSWKIHPWKFLRNGLPKEIWNFQQISALVQSLFQFSCTRCLGLYKPAVSWSQRKNTFFCWLVFQPLWKILRIIPYTMENKIHVPNHQPVWFNVFLKSPNSIHISAVLATSSQPFRVAHVPTQVPAVSAAP
jgi:hypothetical protein